MSGYLYALIVYKDGTEEMVEKPMGSSYTFEMLRILDGRQKSLRISGWAMMRGYHGDICSYEEWCKKMEVRKLL